MTIEKVPLSSNLQVMAANPFFETWNTPFELPPFAAIRPEHFPPAFDRAMAEHEAEIAAVAGAADAPSFANTVEAMERSGRLLNRVSRVFHNLTSSATNEALEATWQLIREANAYETSRSR